MEVKISKSDFVKTQKEIALKIPFRLSFESMCVLAMYQTMLQFELFPKGEKESKHDKRK